MKSNHISLKFLLPVLLTVLSCSNSKEKGSVDPDPTPSDNRTAVSVTAPTLSDGTQYEWKEGDVIAVCANEKSAAFTKLTATTSGHTATFKGQIPTTLTTFKAFYPGNLATESTSGTNISFPWSASQNAEKGGIADGMLPMVFQSTTSDIRKGFTFNALAGIVRFSIAGSDVKQVELTIANTGDNYLGADLIVCNTSTGNTTKGSATDIYYTAKLTPSGATFAAGDYCFSVLSKSSSRSFAGYTLTYTKTDGSKVVREFTDALTISAGSVVTIPGDETTKTADSSTISGKVTNKKTGAGIAGVPVSDGVQIVKTSSDGSYSFVTDLTVSQNVFVIMPAEYEFSTNEYGGWADFQHVDNTLTSQTMNFQLTPRDKATDKYRILVLGDPQVMSTRSHSEPAWRDVCNAINAYRSSVSDPLYEISLGDMVTNEIEVSGMAENYLSIQKTTGITTFSIPGNHDHIQNAATYYSSVSAFSKWFGPYNYAFNLGKQHFIFLDSCAWCEGTDGDKYAVGLNDEAINFLEKDLAMVDTDTHLQIFTHCPLTKKQNATISSSLNSKKLFKLLAGRSVDMWYGHIHYNAFFSYTADEIAAYASGVKSLESHVVSRCDGNWGCSGEICQDGTPRGFVELDIDGTSTHWQFHSINTNYDSTMNCYVPGRFSSEDLTSYDSSALYCNVYLWDNLWNVPEVWTGGAKVGDMTRVKTSSYSAYDPLYQHFHAIWKAEGKCVEYPDEPSSSANSHLFKYTPASDVKSVQVKVTDRWGDTHTLDVKW